MASGLLVSFAGYPVMVSSFFPDNGLASLAGTLLSKGHDVRVLDFNTVGVLRRLVSADQTKALAALLPALGGGPDPELIKNLLEIEADMEASLERVTDELADEIARMVEKERLHFVGFKLWSGHGFVASVRMAERLRRLAPELKLFGGGPALLYSEDTIYDHTEAFDALVHGEGEQAILGLAEFAEGKGDLSTVPNLIYKKDGNILRTDRSWVADLDTLARPAYDLRTYPSLAGDEKIKLFVMDESRGCPMGCAFCVHPEASGNRWRVKSPDRVVEEVKSIWDIHNKSSFRLGGSFTPAKFFKRFAECLDAAKLKIRFCGFAHPEDLTHHQLESVAAAGCKSFCLGIESFYEPDLIRLGKRLKPDRAIASIQRCLEVGIVPVISLIVPVPGQSAEGLKENRDTILRLCKGTSSSVLVTLPALFPRTPWWKDRRANGFELQVSERDYMRRVATYKIRRLIHPALWEPLPYTVDGKPFAEYAGETSSFSNSLSQHGVVVNVPDEEILLARIFAEPIAVLPTRLKKMVLTHDVDQIARFAIDANIQLGE